MASSALQGQLSEGVVSNILQYLSLNQAQGCLVLETSDPNANRLLGDTRKRGRIFFEEGRVVHIEGDGLENVAALARMSGWQEGRFYFYPDAEIEKRTIRMAVDTLLLQAAYEADTSAMSVHDVQPGTIVRNSEYTTGKQTLNISVQGLAVLRYIDGVRTLQDISGLTDIAFQDIRLEILNLLEHEVVTVVEEALSDSQLHAVWRQAYHNLDDYVQSNGLESLKLAWGRIANQLADSYPGLDPFGPDVKVTSNGLEHLSNRPLAEVIPALLAISVGIARYYGLNRRSLSQAMGLESFEPLELRLARLAELMPMRRPKDTQS